MTPRQLRFLGLALIVLGMLLLAQTLTGLDFLPGTIAAVLFWLAAFWCWQRYTAGKGMGWLLLAFLAGFWGVAAFSGTTGLIPEDVLGPLFLWGLSAALGIYWLQRRQDSWGLLFLTGLAATLGLVAAVETWHLFDDLGGVVFFIGLAATFFVLQRRYETAERMRWAKYAAIACVILTAVVVAEATFPLADYLPGLILIASGSYLVWVGIRRDAEQHGNLGSA